MTKSSAPSTPSTGNRKLPREEQSAQALRDNLRRRKAQAQARASHGKNAADSLGPPDPEPKVD